VEWLIFNEKGEEELKSEKTMGKYFSDCCFIPNELWFGDC
jgi:hypothetical protein